MLKGVTFDVIDGEFLSILGPSGCGKTTLLKILIGIEDPTSGSMFVIPIAIATSPCFNRFVGPDPEVENSLIFCFNFLLILFWI